MGVRMRKTLPEAIEQIIASGDVEAVARAVKNCQVGAYLRTDAYRPQLMHFPASQEITEFFLQRGEDINSLDRYQCTPIHWRVRCGHAEQVPFLISRGGDINARDYADRTALFAAVEHLASADIEQLIRWGADASAQANSELYGNYTLTEYALAGRRLFDACKLLEVIRVLLAHGAQPGGKEQDLLRGMDDQRCRLITHGYNADPAVFEANVEALAQLCEIFRVEQAVPRQALQVGQRVEIDPSLKVEDQFWQLWEQLVPSSGVAPCLQGEAVRIAGRISHEIYDNGGLNWDRGFTALAKRFGRIVTSQVALADDDVVRLDQALGCLKTRTVTTNYAEAMQASDVLTQLAVLWVRLNPVLVALGAPRGWR